MSSNPSTYPYFIPTLIANTKEKMMTHTENCKETVCLNLLTPRRSTNFATWNVRTMYAGGKTAVMADEMRSQRIPHLLSISLSLLLTVQGKSRIKKLVKSAMKVIGNKDCPSPKSIFERIVVNQAQGILKDPSHTLYPEYEILPSRRQYRAC